MLKIYRFLYYWLPPIVWMLIIFYFSSKTRVAVTGEFFLDFVFFKSLHMLEYATLYLLMFRAIYGSKIKNAFLLSVVLSILFAASDEFHQTLVPTREGKLRDVIIDTAGITLMYIYIKSHFNFVKQFLK